MQRIKKIVTEDQFEAFIASSKRIKKGYAFYPKTQYAMIGGERVCFEPYKNQKGEVYANRVYKEGIEKPIRFELVEDVQWNKPDQKGLAI